jgi:hypothetical protein
MVGPEGYEPSKLRVRDWMPLQRNSSALSAAPNSHWAPNSAIDTDQERKNLSEFLRLKSEQKLMSRPLAASANRSAARRSGRRRRRDEQRKFASLGKLGPGAANTRDKSSPASGDTSTDSRLSNQGICQGDGQRQSGGSSHRSGSGRCNDGWQDDG